MPLQEREIIARINFSAGWLRLFILPLLLFAVILIPVASRAEAPRLGIVLMHGKKGKPDKLWNLSGYLEAQGFLVVTPAMPWSFNRYLDASLEDAFNEIATAIDKLKSQGAMKIIVAGHSMGAFAALAYAANRGGVAGVMMLGPGHIPDFPSFRERFKDSVAKAREMVNSGRGAETAVFDDFNQGKTFTVSTQAQIYLSYSDPEGPGAVGRNAARLDPKIPLLMVIGDQDRAYPWARDFIFAKAPANPASRYVVVSADHMGTPNAAKAEIINWLKALPDGR